MKGVAVGSGRQKGWSRSETKNKGVIGAGAGAGARAGAVAGVDKVCGRMVHWWSAKGVTVGGGH